jgi:ribosomal protein L15
MIAFQTQYKAGQKQHNTDAIKAGSKTGPLQPTIQSAGKHGETRSTHNAESS